jgi:hypothetical protein
MKSYISNTMKKPALTLVISFSVAVVLLTGCNSPDQNVGDAQSAVVELNNQLVEANREYQADINQFREEATERFAANDSTISAFKAQMANETAEIKGVYEEQLDMLEEKNSDMKKELSDYKGEGKEHWETFKTAFNRDMNSLDEAFDDLADRNS